MRRLVLLTLACYHAGAAGAVDGAGGDDSQHGSDSDASVASCGGTFGGSATLASSMLEITVTSEQTVIYGLETSGVLERIPLTGGSSPMAFGSSFDGQSYPAAVAIASGVILFATNSSGVIVSYQSTDLMGSVGAFGSPVVTDVSGTAGTPALDGNGAIHVPVHLANGMIQEYTFNISTGALTAVNGLFGGPTIGDPSLLQGALGIVFRNVSTIEYVHRISETDTFDLGNPTSIPTSSSLNTPVLSDDCRTLYGVDATGELVRYH